MSTSEQYLHEVVVDQVDELEVARQDLLEKRDGPALERLGQHRVVRVRERAPRQIERLSV